MDIKLKTSQQLLQKLAHGCGDAQLHAVAEIRLFSKWDDANRVSLAQAGAIAPLLELFVDPSANARVQENAMAALLNMSINTDVKLRLADEPGGLDAILRLAKDGGSGAGSRELRASAAALLYSLLLADEVRKAIGNKESVLETLVALLRDGSSKCKAESLKALFLLARLDEQTRDNLLQEKYELISLLLSLLTVGKAKLTEDCLAVLAMLAGCAEGARALMRGEGSAVPMLVYLISSGTARAQENATTVVLNMCRYDEGAKEAMPMQMLVPAVKSLRGGGLERGRGKAEALLRVLGCSDGGMQNNCLSGEELYAYDGESCVVGDASSASHGSSDYMQNSMPINPTAQINYSPPRRPQSHSSVIPYFPPPPSSSAPPPSHPSKPFLSNKYINLARKLFSHKHRKKSTPSSISLAS